MRKIIFIGVFLAVVSASTALGAAGVGASSQDETVALEQKLGEGATYADLIRYAYHQNPSIDAAREAWQAVVERYKVATGLPDPQLMVTYFPDPIETRLGPQDWNANLSFMIPYPGKLANAGDVVSAEAKIARLNLDKSVRNVMVAIRESFSELQYILTARKIARQNLQLIEHLRKVAESTGADSRAALVDMVRAQSQVGQLRYDLILLDDLEMTEKTAMNALLSRSPDSKLNLIFSDKIRQVAYNLTEIYSLAEAYQEEIQISKAEIEKAEAGYSLAKSKYAPDFKLGVFYAGIGQPDVAAPPADSGRDAVGVQFGVSVPLWFGKNKARTAGAQALMRRARASKTARINETNGRIRALYFRLQNASRLVALYRDDLLPQAAQSMEIAETWFRQGESSFSDFVEAQVLWYNFQLSLARARADYEKYMARLERLVGSSVTSKTEKATMKPVKKEQ